MTSSRAHLASLVTIGLALKTCLVSASVMQAQASREEIRRLLAHGEPTTKRTRKAILCNGAGREYFVQLPRDCEHRKTYWLVVAAHGGGGKRAEPRVGRYGHWTEKLGLEAVVVTPTFHQTNPAAVRFPSLGEDEFLEAVTAAMRSTHELRERILLTGYSRGGQFSHRLALRNPELVFACAPQTSGSRTTPDGRSLMGRSRRDQGSQGVPGLDGPERSSSKVAWELQSAGRCAGCGFAREAGGRTNPAPCHVRHTRHALRDRSGVRREPEGGGLRSQDRMAAEPARPDRTGPCRGTGEVSTASGRVLSRDYESPIALGSSCQWSNPEAGPSLNGCAVRRVGRWIQCVVEFPSAAILTSCADAGSTVGRSLGQHSARDGILLP